MWFALYGPIQVINWLALCCFEYAGDSERAVSEPVAEAASIAAAFEKHRAARVRASSNSISRTPATRKRNLHIKTIITPQSTDSHPHPLSAKQPMSAGSQRLSFPSRRSVDDDMQGSVRESIASGGGHNSSVFAMMCAAIISTCFETAL